MHTAAALQLCVQMAVATAIAASACLRTLLQGYSLGRAVIQWPHV